MHNNSPLPEDKVKETVAQLFAAEEQAQALALLSLYGEKSYEREVERVRLAVLKLANGELTRLIKFVDDAKRDYRDVLMWAEYPPLSKDQANKALESICRLLENAGEHEKSEALRKKAEQTWQE